MALDFCIKFAISDPLIYKFDTQRDSMNFLKSCGGVFSLQADKKEKKVKVSAKNKTLFEDPDKPHKKNFCELSADASLEIYEESI